MKSADLGSAGFLDAVLDAMPIPVFIADSDVVLLAVNRSAAALVAPGDIVLRRRVGDALRCVHSFESAEGCGQAEVCKDCVVRNGVAAAMSGKGVSRAHARMDLRRNGGTTEAHLLVTTSAFDHGGVRRVLLVLEDLRELVELHNLIPICAWCKKVRNENDYWEALERYLEAHAGVQFTHSICEECLARQVPGR